MGIVKILYDLDFTPLWAENRAKIYLYGKSKILYDTSMGIAKNLYDLDFTPLWVETRNLYLVRIGSVLK